MSILKSVWLLLFWLLLCHMPFMAVAGEVVSIRTGQHPDKARIVFDLRDINEFQARLADSPARLVVYLPAEESATIDQTILSLPFQSISQNTKTQGVQEISIPLTVPHKILSAFMLQEDSGADTARLVIDLQPVTAVAFQRELAITHGPMILADQADDLAALIDSFAQGNDRPRITPQQKPSAPRQKPIIVIDAGHGGKDPGAISKGGIQEKDITLPMARMVARVLNQSGQYDARLTRSDDRYIKLHNRVKIARAAKADMFISIHADSVRDRVTRGASVYTISDKASDAQTARLAARENRADLIDGIDLNIEDQEISTILIDLSMRETVNSSKTVANKVIASFRTGGVETLKGPHRYAGFAVLKAPRRAINFD